MTETTIQARREERRKKRELGNVNGKNSFDISLVSFSMIQVLRRHVHLRVDLRLMKTYLKKYYHLHHLNIN